LFPNNWNLCFILAKYAANAGDLARAETLLERSIGLNPPPKNMLEIHTLLERIHGQQRR